MKPDLKSKLAKIAPNIAFSTSREIDEFSRWDGDGPDPQEDGFSPYIVEVRASAIIDGELVEGSDCLGSCYYEDHEEIGDVQGYLLQMLLGAAADLGSKLDASSLVCGECFAASDFLKAEMHLEYEAQRASAA